MTEEEAKSLFTLAGIPVSRMWKLQNPYWGDRPESAERVVKDPWWLAKTPAGMIEIGWRKRVISIDWSDTTLRLIVTGDDVTKGVDHVHAWDIAKALEYLTPIGKAMLEVSS